MIDKKNLSDKRIIFRPSDQQFERLNALFLKSSQYKHFAEMLRHVIELGLNSFDKEK